MAMVNGEGDDAMVMVIVIWYDGNGNGMMVT